MKAFLMNAVYWKLSIFKCINGSTVVGCTFLITALSNMKWENMDTQDKALVFIGMYAAMSKSIDMFLDQSLSTIKGQSTEEIKTIPTPIP